MKKLEMKNCNTILTEKKQKYQNYHWIKLININILQANKYYLLIKVEWYITYSPYLLGKALEKQRKAIEDQRRKQIGALKVSNLMFNN